MSEHYMPSVLNLLSPVMIVAITVDTQMRLIQILPLNLDGVIERHSDARMTDHAMV